MTLYLDLTVSGGENVGHVKITNQGHPADGEHYVDDDLREYVWDIEGISGAVEHRRGDGALKLAQIVLNNMLGDKTYVH